ncbi:putative outer membrane protein [Algibacter lectus]|uniref:Putative outer membrane protein n=1 Tax=Algibacter lectus TaxID=221126 RepID=A0A090X6X7_9FLAO|nr:RagB/SusD family nutrient uptake outer membrane protein [Algibacter lectus]GAL82052.1 putative outer membrane protein [Algibacter lectus]
MKIGGVALFRNTPSDDESFDVWTNHYKAINLANLFLESINRSSFDTDEAYNAYVAEAKFLRGLCYLTLSNFWEEVPLRLTSSKGQDDNNEPAAPLTDVYNSIIEDLTFASTSLPDPRHVSYVPGRAHKYAAHGLLARVYLKMSGYPLKENHYSDVIAHCEAVINSGFHGLESGDEGYRNLFLDIIGGVYNPREVLFEISFDNLRDQGINNTHGRLGSMNGLSFGVTASNINIGFPNGYALVGVYPTLTGLYDQENDKRFAWNIPSYQRTGTGDITGIPNQISGRQFCPAKYRRWEPLNYADIDIEGGTEEPYVVLENSSSELSRNFTSVNYPVLRYSDVLLMYAEAANELNNGPTAMAIQHLNEVRFRAGLNDIAVEKPAVASDKDFFFNELVDERARELCFEGRRRFDLIRWELLDEKLKQVKIIVEGHPDYLSTNGDHVASIRGPQNLI